MAKAKTKKVEVIESEEITLPEVYVEYPQLKKYNLADIGIAKMEQEFKDLVIKDKDDTEGYKKVNSAISVVRSKRLEVEAVRKDLKADSLNYGRIVDAEAKRIQELIEPIETRLKNEKQYIDDEIRKIEEEKAAKEKALIDGRKNDLFNMGMLYNPSGSLYYKEFVISEMEITVMNNQEFADYLEKVNAQIKADEEAKAIEEQKQEDERKRLLEESEKLEKQKKEQEEAQAKIDEANLKIKQENDRIQKEKDMAEFKIKAQKEAKDNAEKQAKADADERLRKAKEKADAEIRKIKADAEKKESDRLEQIRLDEERIAKEKAEAELAPDREKILKYVESLKFIPKPDMKSTKFKVVMNDIIGLVDKIEAYAIDKTGGKK